MKGVIRLGDKHSHGGSVITASGADFEGKPVMLAGDMVSCSKHGNVSVPAGVASWTMMGKEVVVDDAKPLVDVFYIHLFPMQELHK